MISLETLSEQVLKGSAVRCRGTSVPLEYTAPDLSLAHLPLVTPAALKIDQLIGTGGVFTLFS